MVKVSLVMGLGNVVVFEGSELVFFFVDLRLDGFLLAFGLFSHVLFFLNGLL